MEGIPPPLSFPAILRGAGLSDRFAHLRADSQPQLLTSTSIKELKREHESKRRIRRKENAHFTGNPHIVTATKGDYIVPIPQTKATFPEPLPPFLSRSDKLPAATIPQLDPNSANAGRFSLSLRGMRRTLRKCGFRAELLVQDVENEIIRWIAEGGIVLNPDSHEAEDLITIGAPIDQTASIFEVSRTPLQLVWYANDSFARYVVHCCARYHEVVSFSKELSGRRLTYLLRPNVTRANHHATRALETPPATDIDYSSFPDSESDAGSFDTDSDSPLHLSAISEHHSPVSPPIIPPRSLQDISEEWLVVDNPDKEPHESESDVDLSVEIDTLSLKEKDPDITPKSNVYHRRRTLLRRRIRGRADSSPSPSPLRRSLRYRSLGSNASIKPDPRMTFYDYLFS